MHSENKCRTIKYSVFVYCVHPIAPFHTKNNITMIYNREHSNGNHLLTDFKSVPFYCIRCTYKSSVATECISDITIAGLKHYVTYAVTKRYRF